MVSYLVAGLAALTEHTQLLVQHSLELVGGHVGHALVGLEALQLVQAPVQLLQCVHRQSDVGSLLCNKDLLERLLVNTERPDVIYFNLFLCLARFT